MNTRLFESYVLTSTIQSSIFLNLHLKNLWYTRNIKFIYSFNITIKHHELGLYVVQTLKRLLSRVQEKTTSSSSSSSMSRWVEENFEIERKKRKRVWNERVKREIGRKRGDLCLLPGWAWRCRVADGRSQPWGRTSHSAGWRGPPRRRPGSQTRVINVWRTSN